MESLVCSRTRRVEDDHPQVGVIPSLFAASVWCSNDDVHPAYPYQESPLVLALPVPNHHDQEEISVCSTTTTVEYHPQAAVNPPLSAASVWCFNDDVQESPHLLALPRSNLHHQEEITKLTLFTRSEEDHPTAAPTIEDHLPIKKRKRSVITAPSKPQNNPIQVGHPNTLSAPTIKDHLPINNHHRRDLGNLAELIGAASSFSLSLFPPTKNPKKPIKNDHRWDDELIDAASSLSLSLPTKRKRLPKPKKPENSSIQEKEEEGVIIAKRQKKVVDKNPPTGALGNHHHHHWIHKRLSTSDVNLSSRLLLPKEELIKYVLPLMDMESCRACQNRDGLRVKIWDLETQSEHELSLKQWVTGSFLLTSNWNKEFVKRRSLHEGDTISMCWDFENLRSLCYSHSSPYFHICDKKEPKEGKEKAVGELGGGDVASGEANGERRRGKHVGGDGEKVEGEGGFVEAFFSRQKQLSSMVAAADNLDTFHYDTPASCDAEFPPMMTRITKTDSLRK
nr:putative B3 domain-containing protein At1g78640 [Ipomoea batatas]